MSKANFHEFLIPRGRLFKKGLAVFSSAAIALTAVCGSLSLAAEDETAPAAQTAEFAEETVLFESDYNGVTDWDGYSATSYNADWCTSLAGNAFPRVVDGNGYISYTQNSNTLGVIRLGHSYKTKEIGTYDYVKAEPGKTYVIEYDTKVYANTFAQSTSDRLAQGWPLGGADMFMGIAVANPTKSIEGNGVNQYLNENGDFVSYYQTVDTIQRKSNPDSSKWEGNVNGWVHRTVEFKVPDDLDVSANYALQIFIGNGSRCEMSFDNIKVTTAGKYTGTVLAEEDFSGAVVREDPWSTAASLGGCWPVALPVDGNKAIFHKPNYWGHGVIPVGAPMTDNKSNLQYAIDAETGKTYHIEFDYCFSGTNNTAAYQVGLEIGTPEKQNSDGGNSYSFRKTILSFDKDTVFDGEWKRASANITVPSDLDFTNGQKLMIYFLNGHGSDVKYYYDNLSVIKIDSEKSVVASDSAIYDTDFSEAVIRTWPEYGDTCGDVYPVADPLDSTKKSAYYRGGSSNNGIIFAGATLKSKDGVKTEAISAKAGSVYNVKFDYYITGTLRANTDLKFGVCVRSTSGNDNTNNDRYKYSFNKEFLSFNKGTPFSMTGYETVTETVEIPEGTSFDTYGDKLALYMTGQFDANYGVYIKNIRITELAPVSVRFVVNGKSEYKVFGGNNISYSAAEGKSMLWYTDSAKTKTFGFDFYDNGGKLDNFTVYGEEVKSDIPLIKGDVNCDGIFSSDDMVSMRKALLGVETAASDYHADANSDSAIDIRDLVKIKKSMSLLPEDYKINGNAISNYTIVYAEKLSDDVAENTNILAYVNGLAELAKITAKSDSTAVADYEIIIGNANRDGVKTDLSANAYIIKAEGNKLYVNGGSANALIAAIKTLEGHIGTGKEISDTYFVDFEYSGGDFSATLALAFSENFSYDFTGAINNNASPYKSDWTQTYFTDLDNTTTSVKNGSLILKGESYTDENGETAYRGGEVNTKEYYSYGYYEIKAKVNSSTGICPAFWLCGSRDSASKIEYEIDVFECFGKTPDIIKGTLLAHNYPNGSTDGKESSEHNFIYNRLSGDLAPINNYTDNFNNTFFKGDWGNDFHTYGLDLKPDSITWYIDGKAVLTAKPSEVCGGKYIFNEPMRVRLTCYAGRDVNSPMTGLPDETTDWENGNSLVVDYLKIYQYKY